MARPIKLFWRVVILLFASLCAVTCREFDAPTDGDGDITAPNITIAELNRLAGDKSLTITEPLRIAGYVTTSDRESNFHKTLIIQDSTGAVEIMAGIYGLHNIYPLGNYLSVELQGCAIGRHYGVLQVGLPAKEYSGYPTDYFSSRILLDRHIACHSTTSVIEPRELTISQIDKSLCGLLVRINNLELSSLLYPDMWEINTEGSWRGYNIFSTADGEEIVVYTSDYATYADHAVPFGAVSLTGILQQGKLGGRECYMIKMRSEQDCRAL